MINSNVERGGDKWRGEGIECMKGDGKETTQLGMLPLD